MLFPPICGPLCRESGFVIPPGLRGRPLHPEQCYLLVRSIFAMDRTIGLTDGLASKPVLGPPGRADRSPLRPHYGVTGTPRRAKRSPASSPSSFSIVTLWLDVRPPPQKKWRSDCFPSCGPTSQSHVCMEHVLHTNRPMTWFTFVTAQCEAFGPWKPSSMQPGGSSITRSSFGPSRLASAASDRFATSVHL